ncbi:MAG TPA: EAL domain-containing protein [Thermoanaerobaculia bacterium]|nr:EAL domain-containing protein [Thermoanaerobaculia bacterium]
MAAREHTDRVGQAALDRALEEDDQLVLLYQPIHDARTGAIYSAEALLRQRRESGELREASIIHEAAEESPGPELFALDHILVRKAYVDAARWQSFAPGVLLNVNLSPREFQEGHVLERLTELVQSCGIDTCRVNIEITETAHIADLCSVEDVLRTLKNELGVGIWLDDFGTGHSAVDHLLHFPIDGIKLPGAFIQPLPANERCRAITRNLLSLAHDLGRKVIAEEVERRDQLDFLLEHGCEYIQGFLFNKPMKATEFERLLALPDSTDPGAVPGP